jgi:hypothetical protein
MLGLLGGTGSALGQATFTGITFFNNPSPVGANVVIRADVTVTGAFVPGGTVDFFDGATLLGTRFVGAGVAGLSISTLAVGPHSITAVYSGDSNGNLGSTSPVEILNVTQSVTTTNIVSSLNPSAPGQSVTFTATITGASPTGTVQFMDGATNLGAAVALSSGQATLTTSALTSGSHSITATYNGDTDNLTSSQQLTQQVDQVTTSTALVSSLNPSTFGQNVTFTATVAGSSPTGTMQFKDGGTNLGAAVALSSGQATFSTTTLTPGSHSITAVYSGDAGNLTSTSALLSQQINQVTSSTALSSSLNPSTLGQNVTITATVTGSSPTGTVQFKDGGTNLGAPVALAGGSAALSSSALVLGGHSITAIYSGDTNNSTSTSATLTQQVNLIASSTALVSSLNPSTLGQSVTFTATVTGSSPTGTVQFKDGGTNLGAPIALAGGSAALSTTALTSASHSITAVYSGDSSNMTSTSAPLTQQVNQVTSSTALVSSLNPSSIGVNVTFTATVTGASPTGTVQFKDGGANLGAPVALAGGSAALSTTALTATAHSITAVYSGDTNNTGSTSAPLTQTVNAVSPTTTALTSSKNPSETGQAVTFTANVTSAGGTPTGTVNFLDGGGVIGSAALSGGAAAFTTSILTKGSHTITAVYAGTVGFTTSTSPALVQAVNTPADSLKLRAMQALAAPAVAQNSGTAISGAVDAAISEGFSDGGTLVTPSSNGMRFNFAADADDKPAGTPAHSADPFTSANGSFASTGRGLATQPDHDNASTSRVDNAFGALAYASPTKAPPRYVERRDWLGWAEVRGTVLERWGTGTGAGGTIAGASMLYGNQVNLVAGLTRRLAPNFLVGVLGGYETFDYRSDALQGRLKGDGWTVGSYLGWKIAPTIRFDAAVAYSGIGYDGSAGTASGNFRGNRWMVSSGLTGTYQGFGLLIEPSARVYALWERENAYTDSLGTLQTARDFSTGRASTGLKISYPIAWSSTIALAPYVGMYGDYYFSSDNATAALAASGLPGAVVLDGFSARAIGGMTARFGNGGTIALGAEFSGIGGNASVWTYRARGSVPF